MASQEMLEVIDSITDFPLDLEGQREHYKKVWRAVPVDADIKSKPADLGEVGGSGSEWVWTDDGASDAVFIYFHGGGYVCGEPWMWRQFNGSLARVTGMRGLGFDYRLAPEHPFPTAVNDSVDAYQWLLDQGHDPAKIVLVGDSAGGALVLSVLMELRDRGIPFPAGGVPMSPWTDLELLGESMKPETGDPLTTEDSARSMAELYLAGQDPKSPLGSAIHADLSGLPPVHIEAGERDVLYSDSTRIVERLENAGVDVRFHSIPGAIHSFPALAGSTPEARAALQRMAEFMREVTR